jgi:hypothetical protein
MTALCPKRRVNPAEGAARDAHPEANAQLSAAQVIVTDRNLTRP